MSDTIRQSLPQFGSIAPNEATFLGGILRKGELVVGREIEIIIPVNSAMAERFITNKDSQIGIIKYYLPSPRGMPTACASSLINERH